MVLFQNLFQKEIKLKRISKMSDDKIAQFVYPRKPVAKPKDTEEEASA